MTIEGVDLVELYGENNAKLNIIRKAYPNVQITSRGNQLKISGSDREGHQVKQRIDAMVAMLKDRIDLSLQMVEDIVAGNQPYDHRLSPNSSDNYTIVHGRDGQPIKAKTRNQRKLVEAVDTNDIVFALGPAGTGKTYTAVALAVRALKNRMVKKIILTRPAVEAGENLGFLPGDLKDKIDPYLRPLYDALDDMFPTERINYFTENRIIEIAPLAYMRGRTLDNSFIILDEAQNATSLQLKMFLTRLGPSAKCIITGDMTQIDLPGNQKSGLRQAMEILKNIGGIGIVELSTEDVVRHRLVKEIIKAYDLATAEEERRRQEKMQQREAEKLAAQAVKPQEPPV